jgi:hypothetical protein
MLWNFSRANLGRYLAGDRRQRQNQKQGKKCVAGRFTHDIHQKLILHRHCDWLTRHPRRHFMRATDILVP